MGGPGGGGQVRGAQLWLVRRVFQVGGGELPGVGGGGGEGEAE